MKSLETKQFKFILYVAPVLLSRDNMNKCKKIQSLPSNKPRHKNCVNYLLFSVCLFLLCSSMHFFTDIDFTVYIFFFAFFKDLPMRNFDPFVVPVLAQMIKYFVL